MKSSKLNKNATAILVTSTLAVLLSIITWALQKKLISAVERAVKLQLIDAIVLLNICAIILLLSINTSKNDKDVMALHKAVGFLTPAFKYITLTFNVFMSSYIVVIVLNAFIPNLAIPDVDIISTFADHIIPLVIGFYALSLVMPLSMYLLSTTHKPRNSQIAAVEGQPNSTGGQPTSTGEATNQHRGGNQPAQGGAYFKR